MVRRPLALLCAGVLGCFLVPGVARADEGPKVLRAGIIGLDTSHAIAFTNIVNNPAATGPLAGVQIVAGYPNGMPDNPSSWDRVEKYTEQLREKGLTIYDSIDELLQHVDVVFIESVDGRPHLEQARKVIAAGKPVFIDKPLAGSLADALEIFRLARQANVPCWSSSSLRFSSGFQAARRGESFGQVRRCVAWSPMHTEPHHPDLFWYGIHGVEILFTVMGTGCQTVTRTAQDRVEGTWADGRTGVFEARQGYGAEVVGTTGSGDAGKYEGYEPLVAEICTFFRTGVPPVAEAETIEIYAFMEAADESKRRGGQPVSLAEVLAKAQQQNSRR